MAVDFPYQRQLDQLEKAYEQAQRTIAAQIVAALRSGQMGSAAERRRQLQIVQTTLTQLGWDTDREAAQIVDDAYHQAATLAADQIALGGVTPAGGADFNGVAIDAVKALQDSILGRLEDARGTIGRRVADVFAQAQKEAVLQGLLGAEGSRKQVSARIVRTLREKGVQSFVDKSGRQWTLDTYARMAARTVTREAVVQGASARIAASGIDLVQVTTNPTTCPICAPHQGEIQSLMGRTGEIDGVTVVENDLPPFHPNCRHTIVPYIPALQREAVHA